MTPHQLVVAPLSVATLTVSAVAGWPLGSPYSLTVSASSPVIVGRSVDRAVGGRGAAGRDHPGDDGRPPGPGWWWDPARRATRVAPDAAIRSLAVADPESTPVEVTVVPLAGGRPVALARVTGNGVVVFGTAAVGGLRPLVVEASGPVVVEADIGPTGAPGGHLDCRASPSAG